MVAEELLLVDVLAAAVDEGTAEDPPVGTSPILVHPDFCVSSRGHATVSQFTVGLSAPSKNEPQRN